MGKITILSDTHETHNNINCKGGEGDILIHCGDITMNGGYGATMDFLGWFDKQPHEHKIFIAGNHDWDFETKPEWLENTLKTLELSNIFYLENSSVTIEGTKFWGSPVTPRFFDWAFNKDKGNTIKQTWDLIPQDTDVLITHGPPFGRLDQNKVGTRCGCEELSIVIETIKPKIHCFGHIHQDQPLTSYNGHTTFINASVLNESYALVSEPITIEKWW